MLVLITVLPVTVPAVGTVLVTMLAGMLAGKSTALVFFRIERNMTKSFKELG